MPIVARSRKTETDRDVPARPFPDGVNLNEIVAYNFRRARELRGLTQDEAADRLAPFLGVRLKQAAISGIEGAYGGQKRREFDAQELLAFACGFDLPIIWFLIPPPGDRRNLQGTGDRVNELYLLAMGRNDQLEYLRERFAEVGHVEPDESDLVLERVYGGPTERTLLDYPTRRKELLLAMLDSRADRLDQAAEEMGRFFDHLRQVGIRGYVAEKANDRDFMFPPKKPPRGKRSQ